VTLLALSTIQYVLVPVVTLFIDINMNIVQYNVSIVNDRQCQIEFTDPQVGTNTLMFIN